jgi:redox-sensitive bicupin YhaK (pirin superfamily)
MFGDRTEFFQIWFEPDLREAVTRPPTYREVTDADFPRAENDQGVEVKSVIGGDGPIDLFADVRMIDVTIPPNASFDFEVGDDRFLAAMAVEGNGAWRSETDSESLAISRRDYSVVKERGVVTASAGEEGLRLVAIDGPLQVDYPLYGR